MLSIRLAMVGALVAVTLSFPAKKNTGSVLPSWLASRIVARQFPSESSKCTLVANDLHFCGEFVKYPVLVDDDHGGMSALQAIDMSIATAALGAASEVVTAKWSNTTNFEPVDCKLEIARELCLSAFPLCDASSDIVVDYCWKHELSVADTRFDCASDESVQGTLICPPTGNSAEVGDSPVICAALQDNANPSSHSCVRAGGLPHWADAVDSQYHASNPSAQCTSLHDESKEITECQRVVCSELDTGNSETCFERRIMTKVYSVSDGEIPDVVSTTPDEVWRVEAFSIVTPNTEGYLQEPSDIAWSIPIEKVEIVASEFDHYPQHDGTVGDAVDVDIVGGRECPQFMCMIFCDNGHMMDEDGCPTCRCISTSDESQEHSALGDDADDNGCIGSAGYTWCPSTATCIRLWEMPEDFDCGTPTSSSSSTFNVQSSSTTTTSYLSNMPGSDSYPSIDGTAPPPRTMMVGNWIRGSTFGGTSSAAKDEAGPVVAFATGAAVLIVGVVAALTVIYVKFCRSSGAGAYREVSPDDLAELSAVIWESGESDSDNEDLSFGLGNTRVERRLEDGFEPLSTLPNQPLPSI